METELSVGFVKDGRTFFRIMILVLFFVKVSDACIIFILISTLTLWLVWYGAGAQTWIVTKYSQASWQTSTCRLGRDSGSPPARTALLRFHWNDGMWMPTLMKMRKCLDRIQEGTAICLPARWCLLGHFSVSSIFMHFHSWSSPFSKLM